MLRRHETVGVHEAGHFGRVAAEEPVLGERVGRQICCMATNHFGEDGGALHLVWILRGIVALEELQVRQELGHVHLGLEVKRHTEPSCRRWALTLKLCVNEGYLNADKGFAKPQ